MLKYIARRLLVMIPIFFIISLVSFIIILLPPGDAIDRYMDRLIFEHGLTEEVKAQISALKELYAMDEPVWVQYFKWMGKVLKGDFGYSFQWERPVAEIIWERLALTLIITISSLLFSWVIAFPVGIYSAMKHNSMGDYFFTLLGFIGLSIPNFMLALLLMYGVFVWFGESLVGLFSSEYLNVPWSWAKFVDMLKHLWLPMVIVGTAGTAGLIRVLRNNLLDELQKPYVITARAKGLTGIKLLVKYPLRVAINPFLSTVGWILPQLISGATITSVVLNLPTSGAVLLNALLFQDMYLAGAIIMLLATMTLIGTLLSDILLAAIDPRIKYE